MAYISVRPLTVCSPNESPTPVVSTISDLTPILVSSLCRLRATYSFSPPSKRAEIKTCFGELDGEVDGVGVRALVEGTEDGLILGPDEGMKDGFVLGADDGTFVPV